MTTSSQQDALLHSENSIDATQDTDSDTATRNAIPALLNPVVDCGREVNENGMIYRAIFKHGRYFHAWKAGKCPFPCDQVSKYTRYCSSYPALPLTTLSPLQQQRDAYNVLHGVVYRHVLGFRGMQGEEELEEVIAGPLVDIRPANVLDVGCGSGIWASDMAK